MFVTTYLYPSFVGKPEEVAEPSMTSQRGERWALCHLWKLQQKLHCITFGRAQTVFFSLLLLLLPLLTPLPRPPQVLPLAETLGGVGGGPPGGALAAAGLLPNVPAGGGWRRGRGVPRQLGEEGPRSGPLALLQAQDGRCPLKSRT